jgi:hypothetical protein
MRLPQGSNVFWSKNIGPTDTELTLLLSRKVMKLVNNCFFSSLFCVVFQNLNRKSMFAALHSDINSHKSGRLHVTGQRKSRGAKRVDQEKSKMELETKALGTISMINI